MQPWWAKDTFFKNILKNLTDPKLLTGNVNFIYIYIYKSFSLSQIFHRPLLQSEKPWVGMKVK